MTLIYLGPLITQAQSGLQAETDQHHGHQDHAPSGDNSNHTDPLQHLAHGECGYCVLLSKLPALSPRGTLVPSEQRGVPATPTPRLVSLPRAIPRFPNAPVRAPPSMV